MSDVQLLLLRGFELTDNGRAIVLPPSGQRLLAFLAFQNVPVRRTLVAGSLWPDTNDQSAAACLRSTLWRIRRIYQGLVDVVGGGSLELSRNVEVDLRKTVKGARALINAEVIPPSAEPMMGVDADSREIAALLGGELLADWYDDWVVSEREQLRQLRLHALELLCARLTARGEHARAVEAGLTVVAEEPLRESAHRVLISAHLAEGNVSEALRQFSLCQDIFRSNLGLDPSQSLRSLIALPATFGDSPLSKSPQTIASNAARLA